MNEATIYATLTEVFHSVFFDKSITLQPEMTADDVTGWDSMNHINLIVALESRFGIRLDIEELESLGNVGDIVAAIHRKLV